MTKGHSSTKTKSRTDGPGSVVESNTSAVQPPRRADASDSADGVTIEAWLVVGDRYDVTIGDCIAKQLNSEATSPNKPQFSHLTTHGFKSDGNDCGVRTEDTLITTIQFHHFDGEGISCERTRPITLRLQMRSIDRAPDSSMKRFRARERQETREAYLLEACEESYPRLEQPTLLLRAAPDGSVSIQLPAPVYNSVDGRVYQFSVSAVAGPASQYIG